MASRSWVERKTRYSPGLFRWAAPLGGRSKEYRQPHHRRHHQRIALSAQRLFGHVTRRPWRISGRDNRLFPLGRSRGKRERVAYTPDSVTVIHDGVHALTHRGSCVSYPGLLRLPSTNFATIAIVYRTKVPTF